MSTRSRTKVGQANNTANLTALIQLLGEMGHLCILQIPKLKL